MPRCQEGATNCDALDAWVSQAARTDPAHARPPRPLSPSPPTGLARRNGKLQIRFRVGQRAGAGVKNREGRGPPRWWAAQCRSRTLGRYHRLALFRPSPFAAPKSSASLTAQAAQQVTFNGILPESESRTLSAASPFRSGTLQRSESQNTQCTCSVCV